MAPRTGVTRAQRLAQMRAVSKDRRKQIQRNPELRAEANRKRRQKYAKDTEKRLLKKENMTAREKRKIRKYWRDYKREKRVAQNEEAEECELQLSRQAIAGKKKRRQHLARCYYKINVLSAQVDNLRRKINRYKTRLSREKKSVQVITDSPRSTLKKQRVNVSKDVKRQLLFGSALAADVGSALSKVSSRKLRRELRAQLTFKFLKKYKFMSSAKPFFQVKHYKDPRKRIGCRKVIYRTVAQKVRTFYEQDDVSIQSPGKKEYITRNRIQKQKRYLRHSLKYLHQKFCKENDYVISYTSFCGLRPFWVISRQLSERDTCLCKKCENMILIHKALRKAELFNASDDISTTIKDLCCDSSSEQCYLRKCSDCKNKTTTFNIHSDALEEDPIRYECWEKIEDRGTDGKMYHRTVKIQKESTVGEVTNLFLKLHPDYMAHVGRIRHQYRALKDLKNASKGDASTVIIHCDFSENYGCKYGREIQSCHFGANRKQITLHTGILYNAEKTLPFCTVSECLQHDATAIWSHLEPIINEYTASTKKIHFITDSPSSQYRNKGMFKIMFEKIIPVFPNLVDFTWNYLESGHGKGAADGVGGVIKRTCDRIVANNGDVASFQDFIACVENNIPNVRLVHAAKRDKELEKSLADAISLRGTMSVHQVRWNAENRNIFQFNTLSCFDCPPGDVCAHFPLAEKEYGSEINYDVDLQVEDLVGTKDAEPSVEMENVVVGVEDPSSGRGTVIEPVSTIEVNHWVIVRYPLEGMEGFKQYIGQVLEKREETFRIDCLRPKRTQQFSGFVFHRPDVRDDDTWVSLSQIVRKIQDPQHYSRAFKFNILVPDFVKG